MSTADAKPPPSSRFSPARWGEAELNRFTELTRTFGRPKPMARGNEGMIVGMTGALAVRAGMGALRRGGSAVDAACTTALGQIALSLGKYDQLCRDSPPDLPREDDGENVCVGRDLQRPFGRVRSALHTLPTDAVWPHGSRSWIHSRCGSGTQTLWKTTFRGPLRTRDIHR